MTVTTTPTTAICKNCNNQFTGRFCNQCGEKVYSDHDRSFKHLFEEVFHFLTHFEGTLFNTLRAVLTRPGKISLEFCSGIRKKYFKPISFFLLMVIIYLLFPVFEGLNMRLRYHKKHDLYGTYAIEKSQEVKKLKKYATDKDLEEAFLRKGEKTSKFLLFIILPFVALISFSLGFKKRKYYFDHFIFSTEIVSFWILWGFLFLPLVVLLFARSIHLHFSEDFLTLVIFTGMALYTGIAARRFFSFKIFYSILYSLIFVLSLAYFVQFVYKFILFFIAIHLI